MVKASIENFKFSSFLKKSKYIFIIYFIKAIQEQMKIHGQEPIKFQDVKDEIFDMVKPNDPLKLTLNDLIKR